VSQGPARRPRVGVLSVYFSLFDEQMPPDFRARQEATAAFYRDALGPEVDVVYPGLIASDDEGRRANVAFRDAAVDVIVFAPVMAAPPSYAAHAIDGLGVPVVIWNAPLVDRLGADLDQASAHEHTTTLSGIMLANVLARRGERPTMLTASPHDPAALGEVRDVVRIVAGVRSLRGGTLVRIGDPITGYLDVETTPAQLNALGFTEKTISHDELFGTFRAVGSTAIGAVEEEAVGRGWQGSLDERSLRLAAALLELLERHGAIGGTVNCHGPLFRFAGEIGICACLGVSLATARGVPLSCTGDQTTAAALVLGRRVADAALYSEFYAPELASDLVLLANGGEGDTGWADGRVTITPSQHYPGLNGRGASLTFALRRGPCTLLSLSPDADGWRGVWAPAEVVETRYPNLHAPNAMLRFPSAPTVGAALDAWARAGATHHHALLFGDVSRDLPRALAVAGVASVRAL